MADEQPVEQPAPVAELPPPVDPPPAPDPEPAQPVEHKSAVERLLDFEHKVLGPDVVRIAGKIEDGIGSIFSRLSHEARMLHAALKDLAEAESEHADAVSHMAAADARLAAASAKVDALEQATATKES